MLGAKFLPRCVCGDLEPTAPELDIQSISLEFDSTVVLDAYYPGWVAVIDQSFGTTGVCTYDGYDQQYYVPLGFLNFDERLAIGGYDFQEVTKVRIKWSNFVGYVGTGSGQVYRKGTASQSGGVAIANVTCKFRSYRPTNGTFSSSQTLHDWVFSGDVGNYLYKDCCSTTYFEGYQAFVFEPVGVVNATDSNYLPLSTPFIVWIGASQRLNGLEIKLTSSGKAAGPWRVVKNGEVGSGSLSLTNGTTTYSFPGVTLLSAVRSSLIATGYFTVVIPTGVIRVGANTVANVNDLYEYTEVLDQNGTTCAEIILIQLNTKIAPSTLQGWQPNANYPPKGCGIYSSDPYLYNQEQIRFVTDIGYKDDESGLTQFIRSGLTLKTSPCFNGNASTPLVGVDIYSVTIWQREASPTHCSGWSREGDTVGSITYPCEVQASQSYGSITNRFWDQKGCDVPPCPEGSYPYPHYECNAIFPGCRCPNPYDKDCEAIGGCLTVTTEYLTFPGRCFDANAVVSGVFTVI